MNVGNIIRIIFGVFLILAGVGGINVFVMTRDILSAIGAIIFIWIGYTLIKKGVKKQEIHQKEVTTPEIIEETDGKLNIRIPENIRNTVKIGTQIWMVENLNTSHFKNGDPISHAKSNYEWEKAGEEGQPAWCFYENNPSYGNLYGKLYNWYAVNDPRGLAPEGWHIPTEEEWNKLSYYLGGEEIAGGKMKSTRTEPDPHPRWNFPNESATNESGFSGIPAGFREPNGNFGDLGDYGNWWSSTKGNPGYAWACYLGYAFIGITRGSFDRKLGYSVRCLKD